MIAAFLAAAAVTGCTVAESVIIPEGSVVGCSGSLGQYHLAKTFLQVKVTRVPVPGAPNVLEEVKEVRKPDNSRTYCLDYLESVAARDVIEVKKSGSLLALVSSNTVDESVLIARKIIRTVFVAISGSPDFKVRTALDRPAELVAELTYDPFDPVASANVNERLRQLGFCLLLENYTFNPATISPPAYCDAPRRHATIPTVISEAYTSLPPPDLALRSKGIYYRPRAPYRLHVYLKDDPSGPSAWRFANSQTFRLENISPILSLGVDRAAFAARRTALVFDDGALTGFCVSKTSEVLGVLDIPLEIVRSIVALPAQAISIAITDARSSAKLFQAETELLKAQREYIALLQEKESALASSSDAKVLPLPGLPTPLDFGTLSQAPDFKDIQGLGAACESASASKT